MTIKKRSLSGLAVVVFLLVIMGMLMVAKVETTQAQDGEWWLHYSAKFVCGRVYTDVTLPSDVVSGMYLTAINIHNPQNKLLPFKMKAVIVKAYPNHGVISKIVEVLLPADQAMYVGCAQIWQLFDKPYSLLKHIEGFVVIMVPPDETAYSPELDVTAKYTARPSTTEVSSIDVEEVHPKYVWYPPVAAP